MNHEYALNIAHIDSHYRNQALPKIEKNGNQDDLYGH